MNIGPSADVTPEGSVSKSQDMVGKIGLRTHYKFVARNPDGEVLWEEEIFNTVVTVGLNDVLDKYFEGAAYTAAWYVGLTDGTPTFAAGDTMGGAHTGWSEVTAYDEANRGTLNLAGPAAAGSIDNITQENVFTISANGTVLGGAFLVTTNNKGGTTGILYGGGAFTGGDKTLDDNDTLTVTITLTAASA